MDLSYNSDDLKKVETAPIQSLKQKIDTLLNETENEYQLKLIETQMQSYTEMLDIINPDELYRISDLKESILYFACKYGNMNIVKYLITQKKVDINTITKIKFTEDNLFLYFLNMTEGKIQPMVSNNFANDKNYIEKTALHVAIEKGHTEIVQFLLSNPKIDVNIKLNVYKNDCVIVEKTALFIAVEKENIEIIKLLLMRSDIDINSKSIANMSIYRSNSNNEAIDGEILHITNIGDRKEV